MAVLHNLLHSMDNEEYIDDAVVTDTEVDEATNSDENSYRGTASSDEIEQLRRANLEIAARARKAEAELKKLKQAPVITNTRQFSESDLIVISRERLSDEEIEKAQIIAKGSNLTFKEAIKDQLFITYQNNLREEKRKEEAKLGAAKGSSESPDSTVIKDGMSREEHQEAFKKIMGS